MSLFQFLSYFAIRSYSIATNHEWEIEMQGSQTHLEFRLTSSAYLKFGRRPNLGGGRSPELDTPCYAKLGECTLDYHDFFLLIGWASSLIVINFKI